MLLGAEFLAMILIVVYVGAVAVLFLFVVMMLDVDFVELRQGCSELSAGRRAGRPYRGLVELVLVLVLFAVVSPGAIKVIATPIAADMSNTEALGLVLYTKYVYYFQAAGLVLLVAMIGAIVLTLRHRPNVKRQNISEQNARTKETAIEIRKVQPGQGL